ncbi:MAG: glycosyltransferase [Planctomycetota bacterium]
MKIALVLEYAHARPWEHTGPWGIALSRAFAERGHDVTVFADGVANPGWFDDRVNVELRRPLRRSVEADPLGFAGWVDRRTRAHAGISLSLTRVWPGQVWVPMGRSAAHEARRLLALYRRPAMLVMQGSQRLWLPGAVWAERKARQLARERGSSVISIGEPVFKGVRTLPPASPVPSGTKTSRHDVRMLLGIPHDTLLMVTSSVHISDAAFGPFLRAAGELGRRRGVRVVVTGGRPHAVARAADAFDARTVVVPLGQTEQMAELIDAADLVVCPGGAEPARGSGTGRLVAEAAMAGKPLVVGRRAGGAGVARSASWSIVVDDDSDWDEAMQIAGDDAWRVRASFAAANAAPGFAFGRVVDVLESELARLERRGLSRR